MAVIMDQIRNSMEISADAEISMECNPGTIDRDKIRGYWELGINRLSIGVQSANDAELRLLGRIHTWEQFLETYRLVREAGFSNVNLDLMSALPGQSLESWEKTIHAVLALSPRPEHLSAYSLILEEGTLFYEWNLQGKFQKRLAIPSEELDREMYHRTKELLEGAGYHRYEISNYAREGYACKHNMGYWVRRDYLGLGLGAASLIGAYRYQNTTDLKKYIWDSLAEREEQQLSVREAMEETMFLGLRMVHGVDRVSFQEKFGRDPFVHYAKVIDKNLKDGLLEKDEARLWLTDRGIDLSNYVMAQFLGI